MVIRASSVLPIFLGLSLCGLAACHKPATSTTTTSSETATSVIEEAAPVDTSDFTASASTTSVAMAPGQSTGPVSCSDEIGATAAEKRVQICLAVSPATHPPCNAGNSCAMIDDEIARSCSLLDGQGTPMRKCQPAPKSQEAAVAVVTRYYAALNAHDYDTAWQQWGDNGPPNQTQAKFQAGFAHTRSTHVAIGTLEPAEGGAGSIYQDVPVTVDATLDDGTHQRFTGNYTVRRVNDVDGATPGQLRWHIDSAHLKAAPAN